MNLAASKDRERVWTHPVLGPLLIWTVLGLAFGNQFYLFTRTVGMPMDYPRALLGGLHDWYSWWAVSPLIWMICRRFPVEGRPWWEVVAAHVVCAAAVIMLYEGIKLGIFRAFPEMFQMEYGRRGGRFGRPAEEAPFFQELMMQLPWRFSGNLLTYAGLALFWHARSFLRDLRERERSELALRASLAQARLETLTTQLQPHFLFNTLNAVATLLHRDPRGADRMISLLAEFLRSTLKLGGTQRIPLSEELAFVSRYLEIERARFGDRLRVEVEVEPAAAACLVPALLLQPLVENSVRHGIEKVAGVGIIRIEGRLAAGRLLLRVEDNGAGPSPELAEGIGLRNTRDRLGQMWPGSAELRLSRNPGGGATIEIQMPATPARKKEDA